MNDKDPETDRLRLYRLRRFLVANVGLATADCDRRKAEVPTGYLEAVDSLILQAGGPGRQRRPVPAAAHQDGMSDTENYPDAKKLRQAATRLDTCRAPRPADRGRGRPTSRFPT